MQSTISTKGQITIPVELREELGLVPGTPVLFERRPEGALLRKGSRGEHPVDRLFGRLALGGGVDAVLAELRGAAPGAGGRKRR
jgi:AbrB family looped-hinge helix DNA binding protein